ncbi:hypothetical protein FHX49_002710 [Microbacterium endophyticum]|uniref:Pr6Pr family membrane protein n=1 Tax=Microbacterium endophyticum TaxID=1526412 RepID=A0A7W4V5A6_9MICO|nr:Pr6Pr family membrane protein [Microbacterium endophyticum]MBB2977113.1 hypothetical protein [Microbacterium endophyticum]NIK36041.1 hypothetical protein [Microbacterium endophyticum]
MFLPDRRIALTYRVLTVIVIAIGLGRITGVFAGDVSGTEFLFYTVQSNILCLVWAVALGIRTALDLRSDGVRGGSTPSARGGGAVVMAITITMLIYLIVLVPISFTQSSGYTPFTLTDNLIHIIAPCLIIGDWLLFTPKGRLRWYDPPLWALIPFAYLAFAYAWSAAGGDFGYDRAYPYPFMNVEELGIGGVAVWLVGLTIALEAVGFLYVAIDRVLGATARRS